MKKSIIFILSCLSVLVSSAQTIGEAFYIYRNDGQFNAFFRTEIDSIAYSNYDADGNWYEDVVTQRVYTQDSLYQIPLAAIDSVGFVQPENILKPDVISLTGTLRDYLVKYEGASLFFLDTTPTDLLPKVGDKLVTIEMNEMFPCGFFGEVESVKNEDGYAVIGCTGLELEDVFESYSYAVDITSTNESKSWSYRAGEPIDTSFSIPTLSHSWGIGFGFSMFNVKNTVEASITPNIHIKGVDVVDPIRGRQTNIRVTCNYVTGLKYDFGFEVAPDPFDFPFPGGRGEYPICPALSFFWDFGMFVGGSGSVSYSQSFSQEYISHIDYKREGIKMPTIDFDRPSLVGSENSEARIALKGSVRGGFYGELGIKPWAVDKNLLGKVSGRLEIGLEAEMERGIDINSLEDADRNTALYDFVDNAGDLVMPTLTISPYASVNVTVRIGPWNTTWTPWSGRFGSPFYQGGFFPHFSNTRYERTSNNGIKITSDLSRTCPFPWEIGFSVFDFGGNCVKTKYFDSPYLNPLLMDKYEVTLNGLDQDAEYTVYPSINVFNYPVLASPSILVKPCPVMLSDFEVTNSQYEEQGFTHEGLTYDYCFDVSITATLNNSDNVQDWGYVYCDPSGREKTISLKEFGTTYTDSRWAYFRNGTPPFICTLYGYVKYVGGDEPVYGERHDYTLDFSFTSCPDDNHPHMIDLGLPSGTKWACCNVGATTPEGYGNYYAWGETQPKSVYNEVTYLYFTGQDTNGDGWIDQNFYAVNIGSDIAGTSYDAATVNWGAPWRMPSLTQIKELLNNCSSIWTTQNGVNGRRFTGPNGGSIFLPAAGYRWSSDLNSAGTNGDYWSSSLYESYPGNACNLYFHSGYAGWSNYYYYRNGGQSVRPVR